MLKRSQGVINLLTLKKKTDYKVFEYVTLTSAEDIKESQNIASLHKQITCCDEILGVSLRVRDETQGQG